MGLEEQILSLWHIVVSLDSINFKWHSLANGWYVLSHILSLHVWSILSSLVSMVSLSLSAALIALGHNLSEVFLKHLLLRVIILLKLELVGHLVLINNIMLIEVLIVLWIVLPHSWTNVL